MFLQFIRKNHYFIVKHAITVERKTLQIKTLRQNTCCITTAGIEDKSLLQ